MSASKSAACVPFFFLRSQGFLNGTQAADLLADIHQIAAQLLVVAELGDFLLGLAHCRRGWQRFGEGLAAPLVGKAQVRSMAGVLGPRTVAVGFPTAPHGTDDRTRAHIVEVGHRAEQFRAAGFEGRKRVGHGASCLEVLYTSRLCATTQPAAIPSLPSRAPTTNVATPPTAPAR